MNQRASGTVERVLRPFKHLFTRGLAAALVLCLPTLGVLYWATGSSGAWPTVIAAQAVATALGIVAFVLYRRTSLTLGADWVRKRGFLGRTSTVHRCDARRILLTQIYLTSTLETQPRLFVVNTEGQLALGLRGAFWSVESMEAVAEHLDVPTIRPQSATTLAELRRSSPELLSWLERIPSWLRRAK